MTLEINVRKEGLPVPFVDLKGEIDVYTSPLLKEKVLELTDKGTNSFCINLTDVEYIDSTGLGILIGCLKRTREKDGNLYLIFRSARIKRIFEITGLVNNFNIYETEEELLKSLKG